MKRLFVLALGVASLSLLFGAVAQAAPGGDVDNIQINTDSLQDLGCRDTDALMSFSFTATGNGRGVAKVVAESGDMVGTTPVDIIPGLTSVEVRLADGYNGPARIIVEADNYTVPDGQRGNQGAYQQTANTVEVGSAACADYARSIAANQSNDSRAWWQTTLLICLVVVSAAGLIVAIRQLFKSPS